VRRERLGFIFQAFNLLPRATVLRNVSLPLVYAEVPAEERDRRAGEALESAGLPKDRWNHLSNQLSGGQMQRVAIARALVNNPAIILADEPTGNLDTERSVEIMELLTDFNRTSGTTVLMVTHEPDMAAYARTIVHFRDGLIERIVTGAAAVAAAPSSDAA
jgi:putative ABC transport system ATP-binding protein